jgi:hypothetical protein
VRLVDELVLERRDVHAGRRVVVIDTRGVHVHHE